VSKLALQADLWYNKHINIVLPSDADNIARAWINLCWRSIMDTLPPHANNGKSSSYIPTTPGIYKITCMVNGKFYIGSAVNLSERKHHHFCHLKLNNHKNPKLQRSWNKYGEDAFAFEVLELVLIPDLLTAREQYWFDTLNPFGKRGFNIAPIAGSNLGKRHTHETREKLRQIHLGMKHTPETVEKMRQANLGKKLTSEQVEKRKGRVVSEETRAKLRGRKWTPEQRANLKAIKSTPEARERNRQAQLGKKLSPETRAKVGEKSRGRKMSPEAIKKSWDVRRAKQKERLSQNTHEDIQP
jgi:group I intron endonuclease